MKIINCLLLCLMLAITLITCSSNGTDTLEAAGPNGGYKMPNPKNTTQYDSWWQEIQEFQNKGLPKSALETVTKVYDFAKKENNASQLVKAIIHKMRFLQEVEEETLIKVQKELLTELKESTFPVTPLLHSMLADQYWQYYANNRYRFHKRSATAGIKPDDIRTWDLKTIVKECVTHFHKSLEGAEEQKKLKIDIYQDILYPKEVTRKYRPTLYDFLAHRAVDFFMDNESGLTQPVYRFTLNNPDYFAPCDEFARQKIDTRDPLSFHFYAVSILQNLVEFHLKDAAPDALVDVDLKRLRFLYNEAVVGNKTIIYEKVLRGLMDEYKGVPVVAEVYYELAKLYMELGAKYVPGKDETYKWHLKKARLLCIDACETYPGSIGAHNCAHLQNRIEGKSLHLKMESGILPATPTPALVSYKNIDTLYFRLFKTDKKEMEANGRKRQDQLVSYFLVQDPVKSWDISLINDGDFQQHAAETKMEVGETGMYVLLASDTPSFDYRQKVVSYSFFNVSRISYLHKSLRGNGLDVYVVDRESGQPLAGTGVRLWFNVYNRAKRSYIPLKGPELETDAYGFVNIGVGKTRDKGFHLEFTKDGDTLYSKRQFHLSQSFREPSPRTRTFFFTDRSIYRPGQTVHFKGLMLKVDGKNGEQTHIMENHNTTVILQDVNSQKVAQLQLRSNDYGTFSGSFQLPVGQLNGIMRIYDSYGNANISVEEYKRPKFQVEFPPAEASYKLDDNVIIKGKAEAYAGYNIDNAEVKYRVVRHVFYPYRWRCWGYYPRTPQMEILSGVTKTDAKGEFEVSFKAVPDLTIDKERQPAFNFVVEVDITDINGETRSGSKGIAVGYTALKVGISLPDQLDKEQAQKGFALTTTSLSGDFTAAKGTVSFYRLKEPTRVTRRKLWTAPDRFTLSREKYHKLFPYDYYAEEAEVTQWEKEKRVFHSNFDTAELKELKVAGIKKWHSGKYLAEMNSKDRYGAPVKDMVYFTLYSPKDKKVPYTQLDWCTLPRTMVEPGEKAVLLVGSSAKNINAFYEIEYRGRIISKKFLDPGNRQKKIEIPIEEKHRGNIGVHLTFIKYNRVFTRSYVITVPWSDRELDISFATFRDKLSPGEKEEWRIKIKAKNGKGEKIAAEMLAGLYDASLDAFRPHNWYFSIFPHHSITQRWAGDNFFNLLQTTVFGQLVRRSSVMHKYYDSLNWFGFYWRSHPIRYKSKGRMERSRRPGAVMAEAETMPPPPLKMSKKMAAPQSAAVGGALEDADVGVMKEELSLASVESADKPTDTTKEPDLSAVKARTNLQETAFFFPHLKTDGDGNIIVAFTIPEALTKWKMMGFAHTKELQYGRITNSLVTQKELMVVPNAPRFFREGDTLRFVTKITNLSGKAMEGKAKLMLLDAAEMKPVDAKFKNDSAERKFSIAQDQSTTVEWALEIPEDIDAVTYRVVAAAGKFSDGEEQAVPILKNRMLVTETMPLPGPAGQDTKFNCKKVVDSA
ncbi:MAG: hypothetical protein GY765_28545, partial [bacterium]|nr:hypothetical protein [bacterium]